MKISDHELTNLIFPYLSIKDIFHVGCCNKRLYQVFLQDDHWRQRSMTEYPNWKNTTMSWKDLYSKLHHPFSVQIIRDGQVIATARTRLGSIQKTVQDSNIQVIFADEQMTPIIYDQELTIPETTITRIFIFSPNKYDPDNTLASYLPIGIISTRNGPYFTGSLDYNSPPIGYLHKQRKRDVAKFIINYIHNFPNRGLNYQKAYAGLKKKKINDLIEIIVNYYRNQGLIYTFPLKLIEKYSRYVF